MKLSDNMDVGEVGIATPIASATSFRIAHNAQSFRILSSNLYKQPIKAIVRELGTNCLDAHQLNGYKGAFQVHAPTEDEPFFSIKDNGPGLDVSGITGLYTTYFESTKRDSEDAIGAMGLGSKSPLGYVDSFQVNSHHNGECRSYIIRVNDETGVPEVLLQKQADGRDFVETAESGLQITIIIPDATYRELSAWRNTILDVYTWFGPGVAEITNHPDLNEELIERATSVKLTDYGDYSFNFHMPSGLYANMGGVLYPIETSDMHDLDVDVDKHFTRNTAIVLHFNLGDLEFVPNREGLRYGSKTVTDTSISNLLKTMKAKVVRDVRKVLGNIKTFDDWAENADKLLNGDLFKLGQYNTGSRYAKMFNLNPAAQLWQHLQNLDFFKGHQGIRLCELDKLGTRHKYRSANTAEIKAADLIEVEMSMPLCEIKRLKHVFTDTGSNKNKKIAVLADGVSVIQSQAWAGISQNAITNAALRVALASKDDKQNPYSDVGFWVSPRSLDFYTHDKRGMRTYFRRYVKKILDRSAIIATQREVDIFNKRLSRVSKSIEPFVLKNISEISYIDQLVEEARLNRAPARKKTDIVVRGFKPSLRDESVMVLDDAVLIEEFVGDLSSDRHVLIVAGPEYDAESVKALINTFSVYDAPFIMANKTPVFVKASKTNVAKLVNADLGFKVYTASSIGKDFVTPLLLQVAKDLMTSLDGFDVMAMDSIKGLSSKECRSIDHYLLQSDAFQNNASKETKEFVVPLCTYGRAVEQHSTLITHWRALAARYDVTYVPDQKSIDSMEMVKETLNDFGVYANMYMYARYVDERYYETYNSSILPDTITDAEESLVRSLNRVL